MASPTSIELCFQKEIRRIDIPQEFSYEYLVDLIKKFFPILQFQDFVIVYEDDEEDFITVSSDIEIIEALNVMVRLAEKIGSEGASILRFVVKSDVAEQTTPTVVQIVDVNDNNFNRITVGNQPVAPKEASPIVPTVAVAVSVDKYSESVRVEITCNECGVNPIIGIRYKCMLRQDYDLCATCEAKQIQPYVMMKIHDPSQLETLFAHRRQGGGWAFGGPPPRHHNNHHHHHPSYVYLPQASQAELSQSQQVPMEKSDDGREVIGPYGTHLRYGFHFEQPSSQDQQQQQSCKAGEGGRRYGRGHSYNKKHNPQPPPAAVPSSSTSSSSWQRGQQVTSATTDSLPVTVTKSSFSQQSQSPVRVHKKLEKKQEKLERKIDKLANKLEDINTQRTLATATTAFPATMTIPIESNYEDIHSVDGDDDNHHDDRDYCELDDNNDEEPQQHQKVPCSLTTSRSSVNSNVSCSKILPKPALRFVRDITFPDGTLVQPQQTFMKIWKIRNDGKLIWPEGVCLVAVGGDMMTADGFKQSLPIVDVNQEMEIAVELKAPQAAGLYTAYFRAQTKEQQYFGHRLWVSVLVEEKS